MMKHPYTPVTLSPARTSIALAVSLALASPGLFYAGSVAAEEIKPSTKPTAQDKKPAPGPAIQLAPVAVTANPLGVDSDEMVVPVAVLNGRELSLKRESTLGETLDGIPGVSASSFGPNASRPVIRGLDGDRIRILQNGLGVLDASSLSFDHAVAVDPIIIEQIDVVRGPAALLYGGSAMGGVVNAIDHRIPKQAIDGVTGRGEVSAGGADSRRNAAVVLDAGNGLFTIHADAYTRKTDDLDIPGFAVSSRKSRADGTVRENRGKLVNSDAQADGGAIGGSLNFENGYAGMSFSTFNNEYGTVAEPGVRIVQKSDRWDAATEFTDLGTVIKGIKLKLAHTDYQHQELEDGAVGTTFANKGVEGSLEATHGNIGRMTGVIGYQVQNSRFSALGDEAFVPSNTTKSQALYLYEELPINLLNRDALKLSFGARTEVVNVDSAGGGRFGPADENRFRPNSYSAGALFAIDQQWSVSSNLSHNERAPSYFELYANGPHLATGQFELGDGELNKEVANGIDAQLRWKSGNNSFSVGTYYTRFRNFISLANSGNNRGLDGELNPVDADNDGVADGSGEEILPEASFLAVPAVFRGVEAEGKFRIYEQAGALDMRLRGDYVRATNRDTGEALPRIAPLRVGVGFDYTLNRFGARVDLLRAFNQGRTADNELATDGYTRLDATLTYRLPTSFTLEAFAKARNLLDDEIREHTSFLKDISMSGGRAVVFGLRGEF
ncbi:TonB-dependent receptor [Methylobacillus flagellatus]|uniref:TonB-dependent receptor n=1 Tax=Methylobacillus flagellatus TaxID=405 RepID=UPI002570DB4F|nr:TonB-dependent receptor [Methylobacillus flagellatus]